MSEIVIGNAVTDDQLQGILDLQTANHVSLIDPKTALSDGFVTVRHTLDLLKCISGKYKHVIASLDEQVKGYALVMLKEYGTQVDELIPMFDIIDNIVHNGVLIKNTTYMIMGQVCVASDQRGKNVFSSLYHKLQIDMAAEYQYIITEVAERNGRSMRAHQKVGFINIHQYTDPISGELWNVVLLNTKHF